MKPFIDLNTSERMKASSKFDKDLFKLNVNAVFGKQIENIMNRCDIRLISSWDKRYGLESQIAKPNFKRNVIFNENLVACEMIRTNVEMTKPSIVGIAALEIAKCLMYEFHYDFMLKRYNHKNCKILYTDTDSFLYELTYDDVNCELSKKSDAYKELIGGNSDKFDTSDFPQNNVYGIQQKNRKVIGKMKDEYNGEIIAEFIGLRSKMYAIRFENSEKKPEKRAKGVKGYVLDKKITFDDYKKRIVEQNVMEEHQNCMRSVKHEVFNITSKKKVLDPFDDKRYLRPNSHSTLAWGHHSIR